MAEESSLPSEVRDAVAWARSEAVKLERRSSDKEARRSEAAPALDFLSRHAGSRSAFTKAAEFEVDKYMPPYCLPGVAEALRGWVGFVEAGMVELRPYEARARIDAADELIEQAQDLLDDQQIHEAAPIVLVGAALEMFLRAEIYEHGLTLTGKPGINTYADTLQKAGHLTVQDRKDITSWAGLRNDAAHGHFDELSRERASLMLEAVNLFMRQKLGDS